MERKVMKCIICKGEIEQKEHWAEGNNAEPIAKGRCCDACNGSYGAICALFTRLPPVFKINK